MLLLVNFLIVYYVISMVRVLEMYALLLIVLNVTQLINVIYAATALFLILLHLNAILHAHKLLTAWYAHLVLNVSCVLQIIHLMTFMMLVLHFVIFHFAQYVILITDVLIARMDIILKMDLASKISVLLLIVLSVFRFQDVKYVTIIIKYQTLDHV